MGPIYGKLIGKSGNARGMLSLTTLPQEHTVS